MYKKVEILKPDRR